ncbi:MAG: phosphoserine phosphatase SerB [Rhodocyclaceae bacterium]|nr:phosphoserine phosphatase SerB [Rhodocyclaceae bacterium]
MTPHDATDLVIQGGGIPTFLLDRCVAATGATAVKPLPPKVVRLIGAQATEDFNDDIKRLLANEKLDWAFVPQGKKLSDYRLIAFDMDSTLITVECIDELADFAGKKHSVASVTESAMRGEIDYKDSLSRRLSLLEGLDARVLAQVYAERVQLSPGAKELLQAAQQAGLRTAILSGGFTYFTERLRIELGFDFATSNELEIAGGKITGRVIGKIVDAHAKAERIVKLCKELDINKNQVIAIGDGANDLLMMAEAGLSVAYHAKPATQAKASVALNYSGLDGVLNLFEPT